MPLEPESGRLPSPPRRGVLERFQYLFLTVAILGFLTLGWRGRLPVMIVGGDDLTYVSLSRSLETGTYREVYSASAPRHVRYPPGYPAWLMVLRNVGGESQDLIKAFNLGFIAVAIVGVYLIARHAAGIPIGLAAAALLALNPTLLSVGPTLLSEPIFLALVSATLATTVIAQPTSSRAAYLAIALGLATFLTRIAGITVVLAVGIWLWERRRRRELVAFGVATLVVVGGWFAYTDSVTPAEAGWSYTTDLVGPREAGASGFIHRVSRTLVQKTTGYATDGIPSSLAWPTIPGTGIDNALWLVATAVLVGAGIVVLSRKGTAVVAYLIFAVLLLVLWPWRMDRLLVPIFPFVMAAVLIGAHWLTRSLSLPTRRAVLLTFTLVAAIGATEGALMRVAEAQTCDRDHPYQSEGCYNAESRSMAAAALYLRDHAPPGSVVLTLSGAAVNQLSGLLTESSHMVGQFPQGEAGIRLRRAGIRYILITGAREHEQRRLGPKLLESCRDLRLDFQFPPGALVIETEPPRRPSEDACAPLARLVNSYRRGTKVAPE